LHALAACATAAACPAYIAHISFNFRDVASEVVERRNLGDNSTQASFPDLELLQNLFKGTTVPGANNRQPKSTEPRKRATPSPDKDQKKAAPTSGTESLDNVPMDSTVATAAIDARSRRDASAVNNQDFALSTGEEETSALRALTVSAS
jgi:hypothetical protein